MEEEQIDIDDQIELSCSRSPKSKKIRKQDSLSPKKNIGHWTKEEHEKYLQFLEVHAHLKKNNKIFKPMSECIGTRSPSQCRSHHQKFNPMSPQKIAKIQPQQEETNNVNSPNQNIIKLKFFNDEEWEQKPTDFNLDDYI